MKNFKLLLATTAILSTGLTMGASATELYRDSAKIDVEIGLYQANKITVDDNWINFGTLLATGEHDDAGVQLDPSDSSRKITGSGVEAADDHYNFAKVELYVPTGYKNTLNIPLSVDLANDNGRSMRWISFVPQKYGKTIRSTDQYYIEEYKIGGSVNLAEVGFDGKYTGSFTITAIVETE